MKRRTLFSAAAALAPLALSTTAHANAAAPVLMGTGDLGVVIERASGAVSGSDVGIYGSRNRFQ